MHYYYYYSIWFIAGISCIYITIISFYYIHISTYRYCTHARNLVWIGGDNAPSAAHSPTNLSGVFRRCRRQCDRTWRNISAFLFGLAAKPDARVARLAAPPGLQWICSRAKRTRGGAPSVWGDKVCYLLRAFLGKRSRWRKRRPTRSNVPLLHFPGPWRWLLAAKQAISCR